LGLGGSLVKEESLAAIESRTFSASQPFQTPQVIFLPLVVNSFFHFLGGRFGGETVSFPREKKKGEIKTFKMKEFFSYLASYPLFTFLPSILTVSRLLKRGVCSHPALQRQPFQTLHAGASQF
jgi:hypothetical protein